ncbi:AAA family ATPase [Ferrimonas marina]|uniref:Plasmid segregation oscillating ATPase ParF n=1 Tax=Ferrimonas marina TaxID=299255 RepID=A0A1M5R5Q5_9GAMM|nr:AAA family ATPase [Ferrimonas marina]SHH21705.1 plasmid segregation oscillating ATPase ParF [Ferrimonas marina]
MIILVGGEKGGSGKSCLAQNLAVYLASECQLTVMLVDCDPQRTTANWVQARNERPELTKLHCVQMFGKIRDDLSSLANHYEAVVVDCGGQDTLAQRAAMSVANFALLPLRPKRRDLQTVPHIDELLNTSLMFNPDLNAAFVMTQCPSLPNQAKRILEAKSVCQSWEIRVLDALTYQRNIYDDSEEAGSSVMEMEPNGKAASELRAIFNELLGEANARTLELRYARSVQLVEREEMQYGIG